MFGAFSKGEKVTNTLEIVLAAQSIDMLTLGIVNNGLHRVINKIAIQTVEFPPEILDEFYFRNRSQFYRYHDPILIRAEIKAIEQGSVRQIVEPILATGAALDSDTRAILQNLAANVIWACGRFVSRKVRTMISGELPPPPSTHIDVGSNIRSMVNRLAATDRPCSLTIKETSPNGAQREVKMEIHNER